MNAVAIFNCQETLYSLEHTKYVKIPYVQILS